MFIGFNSQFVRIAAMDKGIGLTSARGSGTNGFVQRNKFFSEPEIGKSADTGKFSGAAVTRRENEEIAEHYRKREIEVKLFALQQKLADQGFTDSEIAEKLADARRTLEAKK